MAGHSKWANIQHRKGAQDAKRGKLFTKLIREITVAARLGGGDAEQNPRLRAAVTKGLAGNMTKETIDRAIKRGAGGLEGENVEELIYEGYGTQGVAVLVECMTDNKNRTVAEVRHAFAKSGGNLGTGGSVAYLFKKVGMISFDANQNEEPLMGAALEAGADDVIINDDGSIDVITEAYEFPNVKDQLEASGFQTEQAEITMKASTTVSLDVEGAQKIMRLVDMLEDLDDVQNVWSNADIVDDVLAQL